MSRRRLLAALALGLLAAIALPAAPASAHAALVRTSPVQGSVVTQPPAEVVVTFTEHVTLVRDKTQVIGPDGQRIDQRRPTVDGKNLRIPVRTNVSQGSYLVSYRVVSADGHPVGSAFVYSFGKTSTRPSGTSAGHTPKVVAVSVSAARYLGFLGLILIAGPVLVLTALWPQRLPRRDPTRLAYLGVGLVGLATLLGLYLQVPYENGGSLLSASPGDLGDVLTGRYGIAMLVRLAVLALFAVLLRPYLAGRGGTPLRVALAVLMLVGVVTWPLSGHPATSNAPVLTVIADSAHLVSMAIWLGGLVMLAGFLLRRANDKELGAILPVWSHWAALAVTVLVLAGTAQALINVVTLDALLHTTYGKLLIAKIALLALVLAVAWVSRRAITNGVPRLRRTVVLEIAGAAVILGLTSALVQTTPAGTAVAAPAAPAAPGGSAAPGVFATTLTSKLYQLQLDIQPTTVGNAEVHLYAYTPDGAPLTVQEWKVSAALPAQGVQPVDVPVLPFTPSHATGTVTLPTPGDWQFSFTLRTTEFDEATVTTPVTIS
jgi:copper transport protein